MRGNWRAEQSYDARPKTFRWRLEAAKAQKERRRGAIKVQSFEIKPALWKNKSGREYCR
jgi:hypothetical protein